MAVAYIFPGLNSIMRKSDRQRFLHLPEVQTFFGKAEEVISDRFHKKFDFAQFLELPAEEIYSIKNISLCAVAICSIQSGVAQRLKEKIGEPDWVMGCSLGDLARAVFAGAYTFEDAVFNHIWFTQRIDGIDQIGKNIGVLAPKGQEFTAEDFAWFDEALVDVSKLTTRFLNVGGRYEDIQKVEAKAVEKGWNCITLLEYPAHSRYIIPYVKEVAGDFHAVKTYKPKISLFSSVSAQPIDDPELIKQEFITSITRPVHWNDAVKRIVDEKGIKQFINVGPCRSLTGLMRDIPVQVETREAFELLS